MNNANDAPVIHSTISNNRVIKASVEKVFFAWHDPDARSKWGPPSAGEAIVFSNTDFRVGGKDVSFCGPKGDLQFRVEATYFDIEAPPRLLFVEQVFMKESLLSASLITVVLGSQGEDTILDLTVQIASLIGQEMITGNQGGWEAALDNLGGYFNN